MFLQSLHSAFPGKPYTQAEIWDILGSNGSTKALSRRGARILETVLLGDSGISTRHFALDPATLLTLDAQALNQAFEREAPVLAAAALEKCLASTGLSASDLDALILCTCTGYLCPGVSSHLAERIGMRPDAILSDLTGLGCGAAIPTLHAAKCLLAERPDAIVATVAVEICSAAYFLCDDPGVLVSACLFGDGASAAIWRGAGERGQWRAGEFRSLHVPSQREKIRFVNDGGKLRNQLDRAVPGVAADAVVTLFEKCDGTPDAIIAHCGGRDVIEAIEGRIPEHPLNETRAALRRLGNLSSPSVLVALEDRLAANSDNYLWLTAFGAGFTAYCCDMRRH